MSTRSRTSAPLKTAHTAGFTLVEILVVLVIIGTILSVAFLSFGLLGDDRSVEREARRIAALINLVTEEAMLQGRDFGLEVLGGGYRFVELDPLVDQWFEVIGDDLMAAKTLEEGTEFELFIEDHRVLLQAEAKETEKKEEDGKRDLTDDYLPHILILSSGDVSPFELRLSRASDQATITLTMSLAGELEIESDDQEAF